MKIILSKQNRKRRMHLLWNDAVAERKRETFFEKVIAIMIAFLLLFAHYKSAFGMSLSTLILLILFPSILFKLIIRRKIVLIPIVPIALFMLFRIWNHGIELTEFFLSLLVLLYVLAAINSLISFRCFLQTILYVAVAATVCLIIQYISYYIFHQHINFIPTYLLNDFMLNQTHVAVTSAIGNGLYRPSAFFTEPSHYSQYVFPLLFYLLLSPNINKEKICYALLISCGLILTTSGVGIATAIVLWIVFLYFYTFQKSRRQFLKGIIFIVLFVIVFIVLCARIEIFREAILRLFGESTLSTYNSIDGRTKGGMLLLSTLDKQYWIFGIDKYESISGYYVSGLFEIILTNGIVGLTLYLLIFLQHIIISRRDFKIFSVFCMVLLVYSNIYSLQYMIYYFVFIFCGYSQFRKSNHDENKLCKEVCVNEKHQLFEDVRGKII